MLWLAGGVVILGIVLLAFVVGCAALWWWAGRAVENERRERGISWWGARNGWRYTRGTDELLAYFGGPPFDRGISGDVQDVLIGQYADRPALVVQFSWYHSPDAKQRASTATSGVQAGTAVAVVLEVTGAMPELVVRRRSLADQVLGSDLDTESGQFNETFRVSGEHREFANAVVNPRLMELLLEEPKYSLRTSGQMLVVWREGKVQHSKEIGELLEFAGRVLELIPNFVYTKDWGASRGRTVSRIPAAALGEVPTGAVHALSQVTHRGHEIEVYESRPLLWGKQTSMVIAKLPVPHTLWPILHLLPRATVPNAVDKPTIHGEVSTGDDEFDRAYLIGSPDPAFAQEVLTPELRRWLLADPRSARHQVVWESEPLPEPNKQLPVLRKRAILSVVAEGHLTDETLTAELLDYVCDLHAQLPNKLLGVID